MVEFFEGEPGLSLLFMAFLVTLAAVQVRSAFFAKPLLFERPCSEDRCLPVLYEEIWKKELGDDYGAPSIEVEMVGQLPLLMALVPNVDRAEADASLNKVNDRLVGVHHFCERGERFVAFWRAPVATHPARGSEHSFSVPKASQPEKEITLMHEPILLLAQDELGGADRFTYVELEP